VVRFENSPDNELFATYQRTMGEKGGQINTVKEQLKTATTAADSARINKELTRLDIDLREYREKVIAENPKTILSVLLNAMKEPVLPAALQKPITREDSVAAFRYYKEHYWDGVDFWDGRLAYTTFFEDKVDRYFNQLVAPHPDSVNKEMDYMLSFAKANAEMERFLLLRFVNRYYSQRYMWEDAVFVHLYEKYFATNPPSWLSEQGKKTITDRAYSLMANILGNQASDINLPNLSGRMSSLYSIKSKYTLLVFWDPTCGHCKQILPQIDSIYNKRWRGMDVSIYAVAKETEGELKDWFDFIGQNQLFLWEHVYYSKMQEKSLTDENIPGYSQLFDVQSFPTLYLLDNNKRIKAKKLSFEQLDEILKATDSLSYAQSPNFSRPKSSDISRTSPSDQAKKISSNTAITKSSLPKVGLPDDYYDASGSGVLIDSSNRYVLTNYHVVKDAQIISLKFYKQRQQAPEEIFGKVIKYDEFNDLAIVELDKSVQLPSTPFYILNKQDSVARKIYAFGYPRISQLGSELKVTEGIISSLSGYLTDSRYYQISAAIAPGNSGGPMFSEKGLLLGINSEGITDKKYAENVGYSIKSTIVLTFLNNNGFGNLLNTKPRLKTFGNSLSMIDEISKYVPLLRIKY
jgi:S1-C subfamily serine protease